MFKCPDIDYKIWCQRNVYYGDNPVTGLTFAKKGGLITTDFSTIDELLIKLAKEIRNYSFDNSSDDELLLIFDLIQAWGGRNNRRPYDPKRAERMIDPQTFCAKYKANMQFFVNKNWTEDFNTKNLKILERQNPKIPQVTLNFLSKHFYWWSTYRKLGRIFYIYDARNIELFKSKNKKRLTYFEYLQAIEHKAQALDISGTDVEKGIFAFSQNYFDIKFNVKSNPEYLEDLAEAQLLAS